MYASLCDGFDRALSDSAKPHCATCTPQVYGGYVSGIMGDEDNPQEERLDSVIEILSGATEEVSCAGDTHGGALFTRCEKAHRDADPPSSCCAGYVSDLAHAHGMLAMYIRKFFNYVGSEESTSRTPRHDSGCFDRPRQKQLLFLPCRMVLSPFTALQYGDIRSCDVCLLVLVSCCFLVVLFFLPAPAGDEPG